MNLKVRVINTVLVKQNVHSDRKIIVQLKYNQDEDEDEDEDEEYKDKEIMQLYICVYNSFFLTIYKIITIYNKIYI